MRLDYGKLFKADMVHPMEHDMALEFQKSGFTDWFSREAGSLKMRLTTRAEANIRNYPVTKRTSPRLYGIYKKVLKRLNSDQEYPLFVTFGYDLTAETVGSQNDGYTIMLNSACVEELTDEELMALLGQHVGHILMDHIQHQELLKAMESGMKAIPVLGNLAGKQLWTYFSKWKIASSFSADRAALFASASLSAVISLLMKQMGVDPDKVSLDEILRDPVELEADKLGICFVWLAQSMPVFGAKQRIQELVRWTESPGFCKDYSCLYYCARIERCDAALDAQDAKLLKIHQEAMEDDLDAISRLATMYLTGANGLSQSPETAVSLLRQAAFAGFGVAMYQLALCMKYGLIKLWDKEKLIERLGRAAVSRGCMQAKKMCSANDERLTTVPALPAVCKAFAGKYGEKAGCLINYETPGQPLGARDVREIANAFWMDADEPVYAAEVSFGSDGEMFGIAVGEKGLYGRMPDKDLPFAVYWDEFIREEISRMKEDDGLYLFVGEKKIIWCREKLAATIGEILVLVKKSLM